MSADDVKFELSVLRDALVVSRLPASAPVPAWVFDAAGFVSVTRTDDELSIIASEHHPPPAAATADRWRALKVHGPFSFETIDVLSRLTHALATANVSLLASSTHDADYLFVRAAEFAHAVRALRHDGHAVHVL